jgi:hypothetical protein
LLPEKLNARPGFMTGNLYISTFWNKSSLIAVFALLGIIGIWLPWARVAVGDHSGQFGGGLYFFEGWAVCLAHLSAFVFSILEIFFGFRKQALRTIAGWTGVFCFLACLFFLLRTHFVGTGAGIWICLICAVPVIVLGLKKGKRE